MDSIRKNFIFNSFYQILTIVLPLLTAPYISRVLGAEGIGIYSYSFSIASYFMIFILLGLNNYGNRSIAMVRDDKDKLSKAFISIYMMQLLCSLVLITCYITYVLLFSKLKLVAIAQILFVLSATFDINWFFFGIEKFKLTVLRNTIIKIMTVFSVFAFVKTSEDIVLYVLIMSCGALLSQLVLWPFLRKEIKYVRVSINDVKAHLRPNLILFLPVIAISIYKSMDKIMLGSMVGMQEVGFYESAEKIINIPMALIVSLGTVMLPKMSNLYAKGNSLLTSEYLKNSLLFGMFIAISMSIGIMGVSKEFIPLFFGDGFNRTVNILYFLMPSIIFMAWANVIRTQYLIPRSKDKIYIKSVILGALVNFVINLLLINRFQGIGVSVGTLCAEASVCIYQSMAVRKELSIKKYLVECSPILLIGVFMGCVLFCMPTLNNAVITLIFKILVGVIIFVILGWIVYRKELLRIIRKSKM